jgi:hypothetical protein
MTKKRKRARDEKGRFIGDDLTTPGINEAYEYTRWEKFKWGVLIIDPDKGIWKELREFTKWVFGAR